MYTDLRTNNTHTHTSCRSCHCAVMHSSSDLCQHHAVMSMSSFQLVVFTSIKVSTRAFGNYYPDVHLSLVLSAQSEVTRQPATVQPTAGKESVHLWWKAMSCCTSVVLSSVHHIVVSSKETAATIIYYFYTGYLELQTLIRLNYSLTIWNPRSCHWNHLICRFYLLPL